MRALRWLLIGVVTLAGCSRCSAQPAPGDASPAPADGSATGHPTANAKVDATAGAAKLDDLLHFTDARLGVSSRVDNPRDHAEHVADGRLATAWNGKTGDLVGGWIGFRVPRETRVQLIELTVGYVAKSKKGEDLFAMNHRISKVRVMRDGVALMDRDLDPDGRGFQKIALDAPGGDFKIEVLAVKSGTVARWRELVVSEIRVFGVAGSAKREAPAIPRVVVGSLDAPPSVPIDAGARPTRALRSVSSPHAFCREWLDPLKDDYDSKVDAGHPFSPWEPPPPSCGFGELRSEHDVRLLTLDRSDLESAWSEIAVSYRGSTTMLGTEISRASHFDPNCGGVSGGSVYETKIESTTPPVATFLLYSYRVDNPWPTYLEDGGWEVKGGGRSQTMHEVRCVLEPSGPSCSTRVLATKSGPYDSDLARETPPPLPW